MEHFYEIFDQVFAANELSFLATEQNKRAFARLCEHTLEVNKVHNITAIRDVPGVITKHFADSVKKIEAIPPTGATLLDVGTGGGFPTLPLAIVRPDLRITAIDSTAKKIAHVQNTAKMLGLCNVTAISGRAEDMAHTNMRESFDIVTARAVSELRILCEITLPFVKVGGTFVALKGASGEKELLDAMHAIEKLGGKCIDLCKYTLNDEHGNQDERCLILIRKEKTTPQNFPRQYAQILKKPL